MAVQALQNSFHARTCSQVARDGGHRQLPESRLRRDPHRRRERRRDLALRVARQALRDFPGTGRGSDRLSRLFTRRRGNYGRIFLQAPAHRTVASGARRQSGVVTLGAQRCPGRAKSQRACENAAPSVEWQRRIRQQANSETTWLGDACPNPLLRLEAHRAIDKHS